MVTFCKPVWSSLSLSTLQEEAYTHSYNGGRYQQWTINHVDGNWFSLRQRATGNVLDGSATRDYGRLFFLLLFTQGLIF